MVLNLYAVYIKIGLFTLLYVDISILDAFRMAMSACSLFEAIMVILSKQRKRTIFFPAVILIKVNGGSLLWVLEYYHPCLSVTIQKTAWCTENLLCSCVVFLFTVAVRMVLKLYYFVSFLRLQCTELPGPPPLKVQLPSEWITYSTVSWSPAADQYFQYRSVSLFVFFPPSFTSVRQNVRPILFSFINLKVMSSKLLGFLIDGHEINLQQLR